MQFLRFITGKEPLFEQAIGLYERNFIIDERRDADEQRRALCNERYHCCAAMEGDVFIGIVFYWESETFLYLEHLCINEELRGQGYGTKVLDVLKAKNKTVILEIEPIVDDYTAKRKQFYLSNGFYLNTHRHVQPKYHVGDEDLILLIMSSGREITAEEYAEYYSFLREHVQILPVKTQEITLCPLTDEKDFATCAELIYYSDNYIYPYFLQGVEQGKRFLVEMIKRDTIYQRGNITLAKHGEKVVGVMVALPAPFSLDYEEYRQSFVGANLPYTQEAERVWAEYYKLLEEEPKSYYIANVCVSSRYRGNGIAQTLIKSLFGKKEDCRLACVQANTFAVNCYTRLGFTIDEGYPGFTGIPCYIMTRKN